MQHVAIPIDLRPTNLPEEFEPYLSVYSDYPEDHDLICHIEAIIMRRAEDGTRTVVARNTVEYGRHVDCDAIQENMAILRLLAEPFVHCWRVETWFISGVHTGYRVVRGAGHGMEVKTGFVGNIYLAGSFENARAKAEALVLQLNSGERS